MCDAGCASRPVVLEHVLTLGVRGLATARQWISIVMDAMATEIRLQWRGSTREIPSERNCEGECVNWVNLPPSSACC